MTALLNQSYYSCYNLPQVFRLITSSCVINGTYSASSIPGASSNFEFKLESNLKISNKVQGFSCVKKFLVLPKEVLATPPKKNHQHHNDEW